MSNREQNKRVAIEYFDAFVKGDKAWWAANVSPAETEWLGGRNFHSASDRPDTAAPFTR